MLDGRSFADRGFQAGAAPRFDASGALSPSGIPKAKPPAQRGTIELAGMPWAHAAALSVGSRAPAAVRYLQMGHDAAPSVEATGSPTAVRIVLADDHPIVRGGLQVLLDAEPGFEVIAQVGDVKSALRCVRHHHPDVLVLDLNMPGGSALDAIPELRADAPETQIVILTMRDEPTFVREAMRAGAHGYVLNEQATSDLIDAIRAVAAGGTYLSRDLAGRLSAERIRSRGWD